MTYTKMRYIVYKTKRGRKKHCWILFKNRTFHMMISIKIFKNFSIISNSMQKTISKYKKRSISYLLLKISLIFWTKRWTFLIYLMVIYIKIIIIFYNIWKVQIYSTQDLLNQWIIGQIRFKLEPKIIIKVLEVHHISMQYLNQKLILSQLIKLVFRWLMETLNG